MSRLPVYALYDLRLSRSFSLLRQNHHHYNSAPAHSARRAYHPTLFTRYPYKDDQDPDSLKPRTHNGTQGLSDNEIAKNLGSTSFGSKTTDPSGERDTAKEEDSSDPLELTGANQELSKPQGDEGAAEKRAGGTDKKRKSGQGNPPKNRKAV